MSEPKRQKTDNSNFGHLQPTKGGVKAIILIGGPSKGTRFRPLSLESPKPLFPVAGKPLISWPIEACSTLPDLKEILLLGFYDKDEDEWKEFTQKTEKEMGVPVRHLQENSTLGTGGGLMLFKDEILKGSPDCFFVLHCDIACSFPLNELRQFHQQHGKECTMLGKKVPMDQAHKYGCLAVDPKTKEVLHYAEKPETFVSDIINCGVYLFSPSIYPLIESVSARMKKDPEQDPNFLRLEQDVFSKICGEKHVYLYETPDFWIQIKSAGMMIRVAKHLLEQEKKRNPEKLAKSSKATIVGNVMVDPTAKIDPSATIGPNVSIGAGVIVGKGVRIRDSIVLPKAEIKDHACIINSILGWQSSVGKWSRLEGIPDFEGAATKGCGITILGTGVSVGPEVNIIQCIVLPHKELRNPSYKNEILL